MTKEELRELYPDIDETGTLSLKAPIGLNIGRFRVYPSVYDGAICIYRKDIDGEGGEFNLAKFEEAILKFYEEHL